MYFLRPIQWYHSHADPIWLDGTFKGLYHWMKRGAEQGGGWHSELFSMLMSLKRGSAAHWHVGGQNPESFFAIA